MISQEDIEQMDRELDAHMAQADTSPPAAASAEDVERMARDLLEEPGLFYHNVAAVLRALLAERDAARAEADRAHSELSEHRMKLFDALTAQEIGRRAGVAQGLGVAAVIAADMAKEARERAARRFLRTSKARDLGAADALAALCDRIGEEMRRRA